MKNLLNKYPNPLYLLFLIGLMVFTSSCKTKKEAALVPLKERSGNELIQVIATHTLRYNTFSAKVNVDFKPGEKNKNISAPANLRIIKGRAIQLSFQIPILNTEVFRVMFTPDSVLLIDRSAKAYVAEAIQDIKASADFAFDYYNLESLFTNQLFIAGRSDVTPADYPLFSVDQMKYNAFLRTKDWQKVTYTFTCDYTDRIRKTELESNSKKMNLDWSYDEFGPVSNTQQVFPLKMKMDLQLPSDRATMDLSFSRVELNNDISIDFKIPEKYTRLSLSDVIRIINNL